MIGDYDYSISSQNGADYNSINDLMGTVDEIIAVGKPGKDYDRDVVFPMVRNSAILYFHFTSNLEDEVIGATLSTKNGDLAFSNVSIYYSEEYESIAIDQEDAVDNIVLSTSQDATDFTLWFNVEQGDLEDLTLTVATECGKTFTLTRAGEAYYNSGSAYTVDMAIADEKWVDGEDAEGTEYTVSKTIGEIVEDEEYTVSAGTDIGDMITSIALDDVLTMSTDGTANSGTFWGTTTIDWRLYQNTGANLKFAVKEGYYIQSVKVTYSSSNGGSLYDGGVAMASNAVDDNINLPNVTYTIGSTTGKTNGQVRVAAVEVVYVKGKIDAIVATGIELDAEELILEVGETATINATVTPSNATIKNVIWESSDKDVATVSNGTITAVGEGEAEITATVEGTEISASCAVTVSAVDALTLEELVATVTPTSAGTTVTVVLDEETITGFATNASGYKNGVFLMAGTKEIEIYCTNVPAGWIVGRTLSGTITCPWKVYSGTWELCPASWKDLDYTAPAVIPTYSVIVPTVEGGTLVASPEEAKEGDTVTITATPASGYVLSGLTAGVSGETLSSNVLTFTMPGKDVTISASFASASAESAEFGPDWNAIFGTSYTGSVTGIVKNEFTLSGTSNGVSIEVNNGISTNGYVKSGDFRLYNGYTMTFTAPTGKNITKITATKGGKTITAIAASTGKLTIASDSASMTWEGESNDVTFSISGTMGFGSITVFYE